MRLTRYFFLIDASPRCLCGLAWG